MCCLLAPVIVFVFLCISVCVCATAMCLGRGCTRPQQPQKQRRGLSVGAALEIHSANDQGAKNDKNSVSHDAPEHRCFRMFRVPNTLAVVAVAVAACFP